MPIAAPELSPWASAKIFISYRREETGYAAGWLFDRLTKRFGRDLVFRDLENIELGENFVEEIKRAISSCDVLLALIGDRWLTIRDDNLRCRLEVPEDYVRLEIEAALERDVYVIPILVAGAKMPKAEALPPSLAELVNRNAHELSPSRFDSDADKLITVLDRILSGRWARVWKRTGLLVGGSLVLVLALLLATFLWWPSKQAPVAALPASGALPASSALPADSLVVPRKVDGIFHLYVVSANGGPAVRVETPVAAHAPVLSRNRQTIIYLAGVRGASTPRVMAANGDGDRDLFAKPPANCTSVEHVAWSRTDARLLALVCTDDQGLTKIVLVRVDGTFVRTLPTGDSHIDDATFSRDGTHIAYWAGAGARGALFSIVTSGLRSPRPLASGSGNTDIDPAWSPVDDRLAFSRSKKQAGGRRTSAIYVISPADGQPTRLSRGPYLDEKPVWSPNGEQIAYVRTTAGPSGAATQQLWVMDALGGSAQPVGAKAEAIGTPTWGLR